ncbi:MAG: phosphoenolpyruvate carboxylase [Thermoleophilaceae bacterium]
MTELRPTETDSPPAAAAGPVHPRARAERTFADDERLLGELLAEVIEDGHGEHVLELHEQAVKLGKRSRAGEDSAADELARFVEALPLSDMQILVRSLTAWFQLVNLAEDNDRARRIRARHAASPAVPRRGSMADAVQRLAGRGTTSVELQETLARAELRLVMTAHPTDARRGTIVRKLARAFAILRGLDQSVPVPGDEAAARRRLAPAIQELWGSDEVRAVSLTVAEEVRAGLVYFTSTLCDAVPAWYRELESAIADSFPGAEIEVPPLLSFGSWIGGDRDGNPYVTPALTAETLGTMRVACLRFLEGRVAEVGAKISLSTRVIGPAEELAPLLAGGAERFAELAASLERRYPEEPYRRVFELVRERVRATRVGGPGYADPAGLLEDLRLVERSLEGGKGRFIAAGELRDLIRQVEVFGFHFARLDVREHARVHRAALAEIFSVLGVHESYESLPDGERVALLVREIAERRPLVPTDLRGFAPGTREVVETFRAIHALLEGDHAGAVQAYVISGTTGPADVLEVLLLMKETMLARAGGEDAMLRVVPLFETGETLEAAADTMRALLEIPCYRAALRAVGDEQEIMLGYSDSNKDVGYVASAWATHRAQTQLAAVLREHGLWWTFFHGRGGAVGRGGGPSNVAILGQPTGTVGGRLKMTEQGEVVSSKYSIGEIAERELELVGSAVLSSTLDRDAGPAPDPLRRFEQVIATMAARSSEDYRALVYGEPGFSAFFHAATPVDEVSQLRLGSRPAKRRESDAIEDFRAIPWVFSWTQARVVLPGWFGLGTALGAARREHGIELLRAMERDWPFFAGLLSNAEMACAKADMEIGRRYAALCPDADLRDRVWHRIESEFELTCDELVKVTGCERLLDREPALQRSIDRRKPYIDPLSFVQVELLRRARAGQGAEELTRVSFLAINGIAGGLRNTG